jgi:hypothetical protein
MKSIIVRLALFCLVALVAAGVSAQEKKTEVEKVGRPEVPPTGIDQRMAQVPEEILIRFVDEPSHHFGLAREHFLKKDYAKSADEIRKSVGFVKLEMARSSEEGQKALADATIRLEKLAENVENGSVKSVDEIDAALARAEHALAFHHALKAEKNWQANNLLGAGHDLKAASMNLKNSLKYAGVKAEVETDAAVKDANEIGQKLLEGTRLEDERINAAMNALGDKIDEAGDKIDRAIDTKEQPKK